MGHDHIIVFAWQSNIFKNIVYKYYTISKKTSNTKIFQLQSPNKINKKYKTKKIQSQKEFLKT